MLILKTEFGNFSSIKDLFLFMKEENLNEIEIKAEYIFDKFFLGTLSFQKVSELYKEEIQLI